MATTVRPRADFRTVQPPADLRREAAGEFIERMDDLLAQDDGAVAIDLTEVEAIDSSGLSALIEVVTRGRLRHIRVVLLNPNVFVAGLFHAARLDEWFEIQKV